MNIFVFAAGCLIWVWLLAWFTAGAIYLVARCKSLPRLARAWGWALIGLTILPIAAVAWVGAIASAHAHDARGHFREAFGEPPSADVTALRGYESGSWDSQEVFLRFNATAETFQRLRPRHLKRENMEALRTYRRDSSMPLWWVMPTAENTEVYVARYDDKGRQRFGTEFEMMAFDPKTGQVWYHYMGLD